MSDVMMEDVEIEIVDELEEEDVQGPQPQFDIFVDKKTEDDFKSYLHSELDASYNERSKLFAKLRTWRRMSDNTNTSGREPSWEGASDVNVPVIPIILKTASARLRNTFNARKPFWSIKALNSEAGNPWIEKAGVLEKYFNIISNSRYDLDLYKKNNMIMTDLPIAGTVYVRVPWTHLERNIMQEGEDDAGLDTGPQIRRQIMHDGPEIIPMRVENVFFRESFQDLQSCPWFSFLHTMSWHEVNLYANNDIFSYIDDIKNSGRVGVEAETEYEYVDQQNRNVHAQYDRKESSWIWDIYEVWAYYDVDGDGTDEDILCYFHKKTNTLLSVEYNKLGVRPVREIPFYQRPWDIEGQGVTELSEDLQDEINALHNMRNDGIHMTEAPQFAVRRGSGIRPKDKIKPGKIHFLDDPSTDIRLLQTSKSYVETAQLEALDYSYLERVTGIQDISGGFSSSMMKSRDTASSQSLRLSAGSEVFMGIIEGVDLAYQDMAEMIFRQLVAHKVEVIEKERAAERMSQEDVAILEEILNLDIDALPYVLAFKARLVQEAETYEGKRQSLLTLVTLYQTYIQGILPLMMQTYQGKPEILQAFMAKFIEGATALMEKIFRFFGEEDVDDYMFSSDKVETLNQIMGMMMGQNQMMGGMANGSQTGAVPPGGGGVGGGPADMANVGGVGRPPGI